jgi:hypothetical protein
MKPLAFAAALLASVALSQDVQRNTDETIAVVKVIPDTKAHNKLGWTTMLGSVCFINIVESGYPYALGHELRHCFEGDWHGSTNNSETCWIRNN